jgi:peptide/nickel transport system substrate-binding protein
MPRPLPFNCRSRSLAVTAVFLLLAACHSDTTRANRGPGGEDLGGTLIVALPADVGTMLPPYAIGTQEQLAVDLVFDRLADPGDSLNTIGDRGFVPRLADRWDWTHDSLAIAFHLNPGARWHDGVPVRAGDVAFTYRLYVNPAAGVDAASQLAAIDSVSTPDSLTAVFWFKHRYPEQFFDATYQMLICPAHLLQGIAPTDLRTSAFTHKPVGDGRFRLANWTPGSTIELITDTMNFRGRAKLDRVILSITSSPSTALTKLLAGDADVYESIAPASLAEVMRHPDIVTVPHDDPSYGFLWFNLRTGTPKRPHPIFGDRMVRQALAMALDRERIVRNVFDTLAVVANGPFARLTSSADATTEMLPYDTARANRLLDSAGWHRGADGVRQKNGRPLAFSLLVPASSKVRQQMSLLVQDQLTRVGAHVTVDAGEFRMVMHRLTAGDFDATLQLWHTDGAMSDLRQTWTTAAEKTGANWGSYENPVFDALIDSALTVTDPRRTQAYLHRAYTVINTDVPAVWLYQPRQVAGVNRRVHTAYLRPDAWFAHLADWYIPVASQLPRDKIGLAAMPR